MPSRKTSPLPTRVYRYALKPPTLNAELVEKTFVDARIYYNQLVTIENARRQQYREARAKLFPAYSDLEAQIKTIDEAVRIVRNGIRASKSHARSRKVDPEAKAQLNLLTPQLQLARSRLRQLRTEISTSPELEQKSQIIGQRANQAVKDLRPTLYWGTYQLCEADALQAAKKSPYEVAYNETPPHLLRSRIGIQFIGGLAASDVDHDTRIQIVDPPKFRQTGKNLIWRAKYEHDAQGKKIPCRLRIRIGSEQRAPIWAEFPLSLDRPLPADAVLKSAYVTRQPLRERNPWQYHLCIVLESQSFERTIPSIHQEGTTTVNFGWRQLDGGRLRVATINRDGQTPEFVELPADFTSGLDHCRKLQSLLDEKFDEVKRQLSDWLASNTCPDGFRQSFDHLTLWKSQHRLNELVRYWGDHRFASDEGIWTIASCWMERYLHLHDWMVNQRRRLMNWRDDYYRCCAKKLATTSAKIVIDACNLDELARLPNAEEKQTGGSLARLNRTLASPSDLRLRILRAGSKYHCEILAAPTVNGTKRCNICGAIQNVKALEHTCTCGALWDQDVNNTDNLHEAITRGEVVPLVVPASSGENNNFQRSRTTTYGVARKALGK